MRTAQTLQCMLTRTMRLWFLAGRHIVVSAAASYPWSNNAQHAQTRYGRGHAGERGRLRPVHALRILPPLDISGCVTTGWMSAGVELEASLAT